MTDIIRWAFWAVLGVIFLQFILIIVIEGKTNREIKKLQARIENIEFAK